jgi:hypothetical protein
MTKIAVISCETSKPTICVIDQPSKVRITGRHRSDLGSLGGSHADRAVNCGPVIQPANCGRLLRRAPQSTSCRAPALAHQFTAHMARRADSICFSLLCKGRTLRGTCSIGFRERRRSPSPRPGDSINLAERLTKPKESPVYKAFQNQVGNAARHPAFSPLANWPSRAARLALAPAHPPK